MANTTRFRITEVEFYLTGKAHPDPFTHKDAQQLKSAEWYFHRNGAKYRDGNYKGLDVSFGKNCHGGILIRGLEDLSSGKLFDGPCVSVNQLLASVGGFEIPDLVKKDCFKWNAFSPEGCLHLRDNKFPLKARNVISCPRVGLTLKRTDGDRPQYICKDYRYLNRPAEIKKGKINMVVGLLAQQRSLDEINRWTGTPLPLLKTWVNRFREGESLGSTAKFKGVDLEPLVLAELMGACFGIYTKPHLQQKTPQKTPLHTPQKTPQQTPQKATPQKIVMSFTPRTPQQKTPLKISPVVSPRTSPRRSPHKDLGPNEKNDDSTQSIEEIEIIEKKNDESTQSIDDVEIIEKKTEKDDSTVSIEEIL